MAVKWYRKAADQGSAEAQWGLGWMYRNGKGGLEQSDAMAIKWYQKAADQGCSAAQNNLALMHKNGKPPLPSTAVRIF